MTSFRLVDIEIKRSEQIQDIFWKQKDGNQ